MLGYGFWQRRFGGIASAIGKQLRLSDTVYTIVGVAPPGLPGPIELWTRLSFNGVDAGDRGSRSLAVYGRLKPGVTTERAQTEMETIARRLAQQYRDVDENWSIRSITLVDTLIGDVRPALLMLLAAAGCVLVIGAANLANLFLVRCLARQRELAVRAALGASRGRLLRELLLEATLLGVTAGIIGVGLSIVGVPVLRMLAPEDLPRIGQIGVDARVVGFCAAMTLATVLIFGALPAWQVSWHHVADFLKEGGRGTGSARQRWVQDGLVIAQVAIALVLLTGAGLLVASFQHFRRMDPGFRPDGVLTAQITLPPQRYPTPERQAAFIASVIEHLRALPGVEDASASTALPSFDGYKGAFTIAGDPPPDATHMPQADVACVSPTYFHLMGIPLRRGRTLLPSEDTPTSKAVMVDQRLAQRYLAGHDVLGVGLIAAPDTLRVVGVVAPVKQDGLAAAEDFPVLYVPLSACPSDFTYVAIRTSRNPKAQTAAVRRAIAHLDTDVPVSDVQTMTERMGQSIAITRFSTFLASLFAAIALVLGAIGIYSVLAYIVSQRRRETAVRIALGASPGDVVGAVLRSALTLTGIGIVLGSLAAWLLARVLANLFIGVNPHDSTIFVGAAALFAVVALAAASIPAIRMTRVDPTVALNST